jgi:hypothetical protein
MKKPQRNFVVEYKSGGRRPVLKPTSIWGNVDLKAISLEVETDVPSRTLRATEKNVNSGLSRMQMREQILTKTIDDPKKTLPPQEKRMAGETTQALRAESTSVATATPTTEPEKRRGRQARTISSNQATGDEKPLVSGDTKVAKAKVAKQPHAAKSTAVADAKGAGKPPRKTGAPKQESVVVNATAADDRGDLLILEEENHMLRKLLAEKLRGENADLRKRLGHL